MTEDMLEPKLPSDGDSQPISVIARVRPRKGREADCVEWMHGISHCCRQFPGHMGTNILRPAEDHNSPCEFVAIYRFDRQENLDRWEQSQERKDWHERARELLDGGVNVERITGLEHWFTLPGHRQPPPYKMAIMIFCTIYPLALTANVLLHPYLGGWPGWLRSLIVMPVMVTLMVFVILPRLTLLLSPWLFAESKKKRQ